MRLYVRFFEAHSYFQVDDMEVDENDEDHLMDVFPKEEDDDTFQVYEEPKQ